MCDSENYEMEMHVDVNTQLYPVEIGNKYTMVLASTLSEDGTADTGCVGVCVYTWWGEGRGGERK